MSKTKWLAKPIAKALIGSAVVAAAIAAPRAACVERTMGIILSFNALGDNVV